MFMSHPFAYSNDVATVLAQLCCHRNELPQGAPTSPGISNYIRRGMDKRLGRLASIHRCHYTRYADDLCFSTDRRSFPEALAIQEDVVVVGLALAREIKRAGFTVNEAKTRLMVETQRQRVTGLVVNEGLNVPREYVRGLRNLQYIWRKYGEDDAAQAFSRKHPLHNWPPGKAAPPFRPRVRGKVEYVGSVRGRSEVVYVRLATLLSQLDDSFSPPHPEPRGSPDSVAFLTEGPTDVIHIAAASAYSAEKQEFLDLPLLAAADYIPTNDKALKNHLLALALSTQSRPCVGIFDRDSDPAVDFVGAAGWRDLGKGVTAVALAPPEWRQADARLCIEMLFPDDFAEPVRFRGSAAIFAQRVCANGYPRLARPHDA
jgi:RNA-directed DNA polymerase